MTKTPKATERNVIKAENAITDLESKVEEVLNEFNGGFVGTDHVEALLPAIEKSCLPAGYKRKLRQLSARAENALLELQSECDEARNWCKDWEKG